MKKPQYLIGLDFGTESARAILVSENGEIFAREEMKYPHGLIMPDSLPPETVLQDPADYLEILGKVVRKVVAQSDVPPENIVGLGIAFTACTILPVSKNGVPLCQIEKFKKEPYALVKKWKHQAAKEEAALIEKIARERNEPFLKYYGNKINVQLALPKILETINRAPEVYEATDRFIEAGDWIVWQLTGNEKRSCCFAGYKEYFVKALGGFPNKTFLKSIDPRLENLVGEKLNANLYCLGEKAGGLTKKWLKKLRLNAGTAVAVAGIDAHLGAIAAGIAEGRMVIIMGTSFCHMFVDQQFKEVKGIFGVVEDGILPGFFGYEAGQAAGGDILSHFVKESVGQKYFQEAEKAGVDIQNHLTALASKYGPGEIGLLYLDWQGGNRSILGDPKLSGLLIGEKLNTTADQRYRALLEGICFGTYKIIKEMEGADLIIDNLAVCGGVAFKNGLILQILADVTNKKVVVAKNQETVALGAAILASVASGPYQSIGEAQKYMASLSGTIYYPRQEEHKIYQRLFALYEREHDYFGRGGDNIMKELLEIKDETN